MEAAPLAEFCIRMMGLLNPFSTGNPFLGTKLLGFSVGRGSGALRGLTALYSWEPFILDRLLGNSLGRGLGALKGLIQNLRNSVLLYCFAMDMFR